MKICVNTGSFRNINIFDALHIIHDYGITDLEFNLRPIIENGISVDSIKRFLSGYNFNVRVAAGGWCDFFTTGEFQVNNLNSIKKQVELCKIFGTSYLRLFFGLLPQKYTNNLHYNAVVENVVKIAEENPGITFLFENHDHNSLSISFLKEFFSAVKLPNIRLNFDAVNFERGGTDSLEAFHTLKSYIGHLHIKGLNGKSISAYRKSEFNFLEIFDGLIKMNYDGWLSLEYEAEPVDITANLILDYKKLLNDIKNY